MACYRGMISVKVRTEHGAGTGQHTGREITLKSKIWLGDDVKYC